MIDVHSSIYGVSVSRLPCVLSSICAEVWGILVSITLTAWVRLLGTSFLEGLFRLTPMVPYFDKAPLKILIAMMISGRNTCAQMPRSDHQ